MDFEKRAEELLRAHFTPNYPLTKPIDEMTPFERGFFNHWQPIIAAFGRECWNAALERTQEHFRRTIDGTPTELISRIGALKVKP